MNTRNVLNKARVNEVILFQKKEKEISTAGIIKEIRKSGNLLVSIRDAGNAVVKPREVIFIWLEKYFFYKVRVL